MNNVILATIFKGKYKGKDILIPRIPLIPNDMSFDFKRLKFPVRLAFAMSINKSQGQSLSVCGINYENPCFSHGQLRVYDACFHVGIPTKLFIYAQEKKNKNVVYHKALEYQ
jgi:ATP-dependent DNA helicase PIF1